MRLNLSWLQDYVDLAGLEADAIGQSLTLGIAEVEGVEREHDETVLVVDNKSLTHRPDLWGHVGIARELAAILGRPFRHPVAGTGAIAPGAPDGSGLRVRVEATDLCPRYTALVVEEVSGGATPGWMVRRLESVGTRAISPVVDVTNYVMLDLGQPLHAFDLAKLRGPAIVVRRAEEGEELVTLDGVPRRLSPRDLLIADAEAGIALAGVMGSASSEIDGGTTRMVLESATFDPIAVRLTATRLGMRTEAVMRFEKSLDPELPPVAAARFVELIAKVLPGARVAGPLLDSAPAPRASKVIDLATSLVTSRLGAPVAAERIDAILGSLDFMVERRDPEHAWVRVPSYRATKDVSIPEDLVEEVGRIVGYGNIPPAAPTIVMEPRRPNELRLLERRTKLHLASGLGFDEVTLYSFQSARGIELFGLDATRMLAARNPLSEDGRYLKRSLVPDMVLLIERNATIPRLQLFEYGRAFLKDDPRDTALPREERRLAGLVADRERRGDPAAFFQCKGAVVGLLERLGMPAPAFVELAAGERAAYLHPGRAAAVSLEGKPLGLVAEVAPQILQALSFPGRAAVFDLDLEALLAAGGRRVVFAPLPRYPSITVDLSVAVPERTPSSSLQEIARAEGGPHLTGGSVVAIFRGGSVPDGMKSVTLRLVLRSDERTLTDAEAAEARGRIAAALGARGYALR